MKFFEIDIFDDDQPEFNETFEVALINISGGAAPGFPTQASVIIFDDDEGTTLDPGRLRFAEDFYEVDEDQGILIVEVERVRGFDGQVSVQVSTIPGDALPNIDYRPTSQTVYFDDGQEGIQTVTVELINNTIPEFDESFQVVLGNPTGGASLEFPIQAEVKIFDDDEDAPQPGLLHLTETDIFVDEGEGMIRIGVERFEGSQGTVSVNLSTVRLTASPNSDFEPVNQIITFADGEEGLQIVDIQIFEDDLSEPEEDFLILLSNPTGGSDVVFPEEAVVTILDNDVPASNGLVRLSNDSFSINEGGALTVGVRRFGGNNGPVSVNVETVPGSATPDSDFEPMSTSVFYADGEDGIRFIDIGILDDDQPEPIEDFMVRLNNLTGGADFDFPSEAVVTIFDDDEVIAEPGFFRLTQGAFSVDEEQGILPVGVERFAGNQGSVSVNLITLSGSAEPGQDYQPVNRTLTFEDGQSGAQFIDIQLVDDTQPEPDERFQVVLTNPTGGAEIEDPGQAEILIFDEDFDQPSAEVRLIDDSFFIDENEGGFEVTLERMDDGVGEARVVLSTVPGSASPNIDYVPLFTEVTWVDGQVGEQSLFLEILDDDLFEFNEDFEIVLDPGSTNVQIGFPNHALVSIFDDDEGPFPGLIRLTDDSFFVTEGQNFVTVEVERFEGSAGPLSFTLFTTPGTGGAEPNTDYAPVSRTVFFANGQEGVQSVNIPIFNDQVPEGTESFTVALDDFEGNVQFEFPSFAEVTIFDDDDTQSSQGVVRLVDDSFFVDEGQGQAFIGVERAGGALGSVSFEVATLPRTAGANIDFLPVNEVVTYNDGEDGLREVVVQIVDNTQPEGDEFFEVELRPLPGGPPVDFGFPDRAGVNISDDDEAGERGFVRLGDDSYFVDESEGILVVDVIREDGGEGPLSVVLTTTPGDALPDQDYVPLTQIIAFGDGEEGVRPVPIQILNDNRPEGEEVFKVLLNSPTGNTDIGFPGEAEIFIGDEDNLGDSGSVRLSNESFFIDENTGFLNFEVERVGEVTGEIRFLLNAFAETAEVGSDFEPFSEEVVFGDGQGGSQMFSVAIVDDTLPEDEEAFRIKIDLFADDVELGFPNEAVVVISDDDTQSEAGVLRFVEHEIFVDEEDGTATVGIERVQGVAGAVSVFVLSESGNAEQDVDFEAVATEISFADGQGGLQFVTFDIANDSQPEPEEYFQVFLADPTGGASLGLPDFAFVFIRDDDLMGEPGRLRFTSPFFTTSEGEPFITIGVERFGGSEGEVSALIFTEPDQAEEGEDYQGLFATLTFADGEEGVQAFEIAIFDDDLVENPEKFHVVLEDPIGAEIVQPRRAEIFIDDNDFAFVSWSSELQTAPEDGSTLIIEAELDRPVDRPIFVPVSFGGNALIGVDYSVLGQFGLGFPPGETTAVFEVRIHADTNDESNENLVLILVEQEVLLADPSEHVITILDTNTPVVSWGLVPSMMAEGIGFSKADEPVIFNAVISAPPQDELRVPYLVGGSAVPGQDHSLQSGELVFEPGSFTAELAFTLFDDDLQEDIEMLNLSLQPGAGYELGGNAERGVGIVDNDQLTVSWALPEQSVVEDDASDVAVTVQAFISTAFDQETRVAYQVSGTASQGTDHDLQGGEIVFPAGAQSTTLTFSVIGDTQQEPEEVIILSFLENGVPFGPLPIHRVEIVDNDSNQAPTVQIVSPLEGEILLAGEPFQLEASGTDPQGEALDFFWETCSSTGNCLPVQQGQTLQQTLIAPGVYQIVCMAVDTAGNAVLNPAAVTVLVENSIPPTVEIISPTEEELFLTQGESATFLAEASGPNAQNLSVNWFFSSEPDALFAGSSFTWQFHEAGVFNLAVTADNGQGGVDADWITIVVTETGEEPVDLRIVAPLDGATVQVNEPITFVGEILGPDGKRRAFETFWELGDGRTVAGLSAPDVTYTEPGLYFIGFIGVDDESDILIEDHMSLIVEAPNEPPTVDFNFPTDREVQPSSVAKRAEQSEIFLQAVTRDTQGSQNLSFFWDFGDGRTSRSATPGRISYANEGVYTVSLYAVNEAGIQSETITRQITVRVSSDTNFEPNEDFIGASPVTPGLYENLELTDDSAVDMFRVEVTRAGQRLVVGSSLSGEGLIEIFDINQQRIESRVVTVAGSVQLQGLTPGFYFVRISPAPGAKRAGLSYSLSINVLNPALYFPDIRVDENFDTSLGMVNTTGDALSLEAIGFDSRGSAIKKVQLDLGAKARLHQTVSQLFGSENAERIEWVQVDSTHDLIGYARTVSRDSREMYAVTANKKLSSELFVPHIAEKVDQWFTRAAVINAGDLASNAQITVADDVRSLNLSTGFSKDSFEFSQRFDSGLPSQNVWGIFKENDGNMSLTGLEVFGTIDGSRVTAGLELVDIRQDNPSFTFIGNNMYFTHIARQTDAFWTGIALVNVGGLQQGVRILGYGPEGELVGVREMVLEPNEKQVSLAEDFLSEIGSPANIDWVLVEADLEVSGFELFGTHTGKLMAGLEASTALRTNLCYPFIDADRNVAHGISVVNVHSEATEITITVIDDSGVALGSKVEPLKANQKKIFTIEEIVATFNLTAEQIPGWLEITSETPLAGFELFVNQDNLDQMGAIVAQ